MAEAQNLNFALSINYVRGQLALAPTRPLRCNYGYVAESPDVNFYYTTSGGTDLYLYVNGAEDTTLLVNRPDGSWVCDDDDLGDENRSPLLVIPAAAGGLYNIWVGTYGATNTSATLYISERDPR